jgi:chromosome segregation ATPase
MQDVPGMLASLQHLAAPGDALQPLPPALRPTIRELEAQLARERERARAAEDRIKQLEADSALYQAEYRRKAAELRALQQKYARWEAAKADYDSNPWAPMQDTDPFDGL